jgi:putrescine transport system ATP-binding protein
MSTHNEQVNVGRDSDDERAIAIEIRSVTKKYDENVVALDDLSLDVKQGEFFTLLGPSGSGKSTLLKIIGGFVEPTSGSVWFDGQDFSDTSPQDRPVSMVFQEYALFPHMTVEENVRYGLDVMKVDEGRKEDLVTKYLDMLNIPELRDRKPAQLSGGQRQRVALARSLVVEPDILLLDEPLGPLDEDLRRHMQFELKSLQEQIGTTFVYVTHDQEEALTMSDRICLLDGGKIVETGTPEQIYERPKTRFTATFIGAGNVIDGAIEHVEGDRVRMRSQNGTYSIAGVTALAELSEGTAVSATVRPSSISLTDSQAGDNIVTGTVTRWVYQGEQYMYDVELSDGVSIQVLLDDPPDSSDGDQQITLTWSEEDCVIVGQ